MRDDLAKLVGDAASQHRSFRDALKTHTASELGVGDLADALAAPLVIEVVVTMDELLGFTAEAYKLVQFGTLTLDVDVPWLVALPDLFVVAEILSGCEFVHFLTRRLRLNRVGRVFAHDELDWLGHYLTDGLFFDYAFSDPHAPEFIRLLSYSEQFDNWYFALEGVRTVTTEKPRRERAENLRGLLRRLETERPRHFSLAGVIACDWSSEGESAVSQQTDVARERANVKGVSSISLYFPWYGFAWAVNRRYPLAGADMAQFLTRKKRSVEETRPMWVAVVETLGEHLSVAVHPTGAELAAAVDRALLEPSFDLTATEPTQFDSYDA